MSRKAVTMWAAWVLVFVAVTLLLLAFRARLDKAHVVLVYLMVILGASAAGGRAIGVVLSFAAFVTFDWAFLPPFGTMVVRNPLDWLVLVTFLATSLVAAQLLYAARAQRTAVEREAAARQAATLKDALLAAVSHDLRTPLTSIKGLAHELAFDGDERAVIIEEEADRLNRLVTDLLDAARVSAGVFPVDPQPNALDDLLGAVIQQFAGRADRHRLVATLDRPDELVIGRFDFVQTLRIVTNLVENALKYSPLDAQIHLNGGVENGYMIVRVADRGPGIATDGSARVGDALDAMQRGGQGMSSGLGLSIAYGLAAAQGGSVHSGLREGGGSVFTLSLPLT